MSADRDGMTDSLIERMAKAACEKHTPRCFWEEQGPSYRNIWIDIQRAALAAARVPTEAMCQAAVNTGLRFEPDSRPVVMGWQAMIDAALEEK